MDQHQIVSVNIKGLIKTNIFICLAEQDNKGLHEVKPSSGVFIQFSCGANQTTENIAENNRNCLFTKHLLKNIAMENTDVSDIFSRISNDVFRESKQKQRPLSMNGLNQKRKVYLNEVIIPVKGMF